MSYISTDISATSIQSDLYFLGTDQLNATGFYGATGPTGPAGGPTGATGPTGPAGGPTGATGPMGSSFINPYNYGAVGDGITNDYAAFVAAITAQTSSTGYHAVIVPNGTFLLNSTLNLPTGARLLGMGGTIKTGSGTANVRTMFVNGNNVIIEQITFDGSNLNTAVKAAILGADFGTSNVEIKYCRFLNIPNTGFPVTNQNSHAISFDANTAIIMGNYVPQASGDSINCNSGTYIVTHNTILNSGDGGIAFNNNANGVISNNIITNCNLGIGAGPEGNTTDSDITSHQMIVANNKITNCNYALNFGYYGFVGRLGPTNFSVVGNTIKNSGAGGFYYSGNPSSNILVQGVVSGNTFVSIGGSYSFWNTGVDWSRGIWIQNAQGININSNTFGDPSNADVIGIDLTSSNVLTISNNLFSTNTAFTMNGCINGGSCSNITIIGNNSKGCGTILNPSGTQNLIASNNINS